MVNCELLSSVVLQVKDAGKSWDHLNNFHGLPPVSASTNVKVFVKVFKISLFPNLTTDLLHFWYDYTYWSKILRSTIPTTLGHVKVKVTDLEFSC